MKAKKKKKMEFVSCELTQTFEFRFEPFDLNLH